jgi:two-component system cell cycle response regulator
VRVLIAEDDAVSRTILRRSLEKLGHECLSAENGQAALELYRNTPGVDLVISDWMMPGIDGPGLCRLIREEGRNGYTYFIFLTALGDKGHLLAGLAAGADDYLSKPLHRDELQVRLASAHRVTQLHRRLASQNEQLEKLNERLFEESREDPLTGLGNRLRLEDDLDVLQARSLRYGHSYAVVLCDVDLFKEYNDRYGHPAGDRVLEKVAGAIIGHRRGGDTAYRYGGEEFLIVLPEQTMQSAASTADNLRMTIERLRMPHEASSPTKMVTISAGVAALARGGSKITGELLGQADAALYRAKEAGRNRVVTHGSDLC